MYGSAYTHAEVAEPDAAPVLAFPSKNTHVGAGVDVGVAVGDISLVDVGVAVTDAVAVPVIVAVFVYVREDVAEGVDVMVLVFVAVMVVDLVRVAVTVHVFVFEIVPGPVEGLFFLQPADNVNAIITVRTVNVFILMYPTPRFSLNYFYSMGL